MLFEKLDVDEVTPVQFAGVYVLNWRSEFGQPEALFREADTDEIAAAAVAGILEDLADRHGLKHEWRQIDTDIQEEIAWEWRRIIREALDK